ncbi:unnamed protein product [Lathyrus oleraceus]
MKKVLGWFSPKGSPKNRNRNRSTTGPGDNSPRVKWVHPGDNFPRVKWVHPGDNSPRVKWVHPRKPTADATTSAPSPSSSPLPTSTPVPASASASTSTNWGKSEKEDYSALARIDELTEEMETLSLNLGDVPIQKFSFVQLQLATANFSPDMCVGRGGFGHVYKGILAPQEQEVAIKCLDPKSDQGTPAFVTELELLSNTNHENIVRLIGYCAENEHRMLVYEYIRMGSLEDHLLNRYDGEHLGILDWDTRLRIAYEIAKGVLYLHRMEPNILYRDIKSANVLLGKGYTVKLSDFGCATTFSPDEEELHFTKVVGTQGYLDPRYFATGHCTFQTDVYSFGVVLLELLTGRKALDVNRPPDDQSLVMWAGRVFHDKTRFTEIADPLLKDKFHEFTFNALVHMARYCVQYEPKSRPLMCHIVDVLRQMNKVAIEPESPRFRTLTQSPTVPSASAAPVKSC